MVSSGSLNKISNIYWIQVGNVLEKTAKIFGAVLLLLPSHGPYPSPNMTALVYRVEGTIKSYAMSPFQALPELELSKALTR